MTADFLFLSNMRSKGIALCLASLIAGGLACWIWLTSQANWQEHQNRAYLTGVLLFDTLTRDGPVPEGVKVTRVGHPDAPPDNTPFSASTQSKNYLTSVSILLDPATPTSGSRLQLHILSPDLQYPVSTLSADTGGSPALMVAGLTRVMARLCSQPLLFARVDQGAWLRLDGRDVWGCDVAPNDNRLWAVVVAVIALGVGLSQVGATSSQFTRFSRALHARGRFGGHDPLPQVAQMNCKRLRRR